MRIIGLAGWSGSGKTTLLTKVIPRLVARGLKVSTLKHAHHAFDVDQPGKDSHTHRMAGATEVLVGSANRWALVHELRGDAEPDARRRCSRKLSPVDLVLVEGYKREPHPKLEVYRAAVGKPLLHPGRSGDRRDRVATSRCRRRAFRWSISTMSSASPTFCCAHAAPLDAVPAHCGQQR